ncbi:spore coat protein [Methylomusa anaerophila]|uniref:spore coat protein n=1 Tax=Methylomusa anaerophila TaxID=1930071 RepID=UPI002D1F9FCE|nr:spore coat protein [Methylomusa anaerophila]
MKIVVQTGQQARQNTQGGMQTTGQGVSLSDRDLLQLALNECKHKANSLNTYALEASNDSLRRDYLTVLGDVHSQQTQIFNLMQQKGYYNVKNANPQDISQAKAKFSNQNQ